MALTHAKTSQDYVMTYLEEGTRGTPLPEMIKLKKKLSMSLYT